MDGNDLVELRTRLGGSEPISQAELARRLGVAQSTIWRIENGTMELGGPLEVLVRHLLENPTESAA